MLDVKSLVRRNSATYYDFTSKRQISLLPRYVTLTTFSVLSALVIRYPSADFLAILVSALAILTGFSLGIRFILVDRSFVGQEKIGSIESAVVREKVTRLSSELFDNIAYFNAVCLSGIALACALLLQVDLHWVGDLVGKNALIWYYYIAGLLGKAGLAFVILEAGLTFARMLDRINYLFQKVRAT